MTVLLDLALPHLLYAEPLDLIVPSKIKKNDIELIDKNTIDGVNNNKDQASDEEGNISISVLKPIDPSSVGVYKEDDGGRVNLHLRANIDCNSIQIEDRSFDNIVLNG